jgi:long-chain acyl-CoA synthetase
MVTYSNLTLSGILNRSRVQYAELPALAFVGEKPITYSDLSIHVKNTSGLLLSLGVEKGDRVAILAENSPNWGIAYFAIAYIGAVVVPILPDFSALEVGKILDHSQAKAIFVSSKLYQRIDNSGKVGTPDVILINNLQVVVPNSQSIDTAVGYSQPEPILNVEFSYLNFPEPQEEDLLAIIYTSGTTGKPKGVMLTHKNIISNCLSTFQIQNITSTDRLVSILPLSHTYECTIGFIMPMMRGALVYYLQKPPTAPVLIPALQEVKPTMMLIVPLIIEKVFRSKIHPQLTSSKIKRKLYSIPFFRKLLHKVAARKLHKTFGGNIHFFGIGGSKLSFEVERFLYEGGFPYSIGYGMTEASPLISGSSPKLVKFRCAGFSIPGQEVKISNPNPETGEGELLIKGSNIMAGYYKDDATTREVFTEDGWLKTGDLGLIHSSGFIELKGRSKNMIVGPSGENIYPEDIEEVINTHSMVLESIVYEMRGRLVAKVHLNFEELQEKYSDLKEAALNMQQQLEGKAKEITDEIRTYVNSRVSAFSKLHTVLLQNEPFEKTPTHKIKRYIYTTHYLDNLNLT